ncbi:hypothetical protein [Barrientosiimonas endolithica]|uniref:Transmembrane protein n=1 Tax=Barrientosiimonas endolithica TaxID=1535208 RepID=A0ABN6YMF6_9MICO|nr:hypothetical protein [Barrientosiimonas endolithica]BDZ58211.1 hypothetical protein GCM10025872_18680 [Barrientosiimonas endolithica]
MPSEVPETRTVLTPRTGTKVSLIVALVLVAVAVYWYFVPLYILSGTGQPFMCGSAQNPPTDNFPKNICGDIPTVYKLRALATLAAALIVGVLGALLFGFDRRTEARVPRASDDAVSNDGPDETADATDLPTRAGRRAETGSDTDR